VDRRARLSHGASLVVAGTAGAGVALAVAFAVGGFGSTKTTEVVREITVPESSVRNTAATTTPARYGEVTIGQIYRAVAPGVVQITATGEVVTPADPFFNPFGPTVQTEKALGSGFVIDKAGHIVTNYHVIAGAKSVQVSFSNNASFKATFVGSDPTTDLAVLRVDAGSRALIPLILGDSDRVQVGDEVVAIGNPFGLSRTVTAGIVSALQRQIVSPNQYTIDHVIQTDAAINHGNSGGPLIDMEGSVIGVNAQIDTGNTGEQGNVGIGFAIPSNTVKTVVGQILEYGFAQHPFLGISPEAVTPVLARLLHLPVVNGMLVAKVDPGSGAAKAGLRGGTTQVTVSGESYVVGGDVIMRINGQKVGSLAALRDVIAAEKPGTSVTLTVYRSAQSQSGWKLLTMHVKLGRLPFSPSG
jgi:S1-C subfamily serine protease